MIQENCTMCYSPTENESKCYSPSIESERGELANSTEPDSKLAERATPVEVRFRDTVRGGTSGTWSTLAWEDRRRNVK